MAMSRTNRHNCSNQSPDKPLFNRINITYANTNFNFVTLFSTPKITSTIHKSKLKQNIPFKLSLKYVLPSRKELEESGKCDQLSSIMTLSNQDFYLEAEQFISSTNICS